MIHQPYVAAIVLDLCMIFPPPSRTKVVVLFPVCSLGEECWGPARWWVVVPRVHSTVEYALGPQQLMNRFSFEEGPC